MRYLRKLSVLLVLAAFLGTATAYADVDEDKDKDKDKDKKADSRTLAAAKAGSRPGDCNLGAASADLDVNNIRARLFNNGGLFWRGSGNVYTAPKTGAANSVFASGIWIGGLANGEELRFVGTAYGPWELWPGPLDANGNPPADCSEYDRIFNVYQSNVDAFRNQGMSAATPDMIDWPADLGAPFVDVNDDGQYRPEDGDYPEVIGHQTAWWVMNDAGNTKQWSQTAEIGLEVQVTAFSFATADPLNNTTFYRYKLIHKGDDPLVDTYFGIWSDPDLGDASDDYVGADTLLGMGYVYNGDPFDAGGDGYGASPPALGYDFFQGPLVPCTAENPCDEEGGHTDPDGTFHPDSTRIQMTKFVYYNNDGTVIGNPDGDTDDPYNYLRGIWRDGTQMTFGGTGYGGDTPTDYMFPGDPVQRQFWSEENTDGTGSRNTPSDRRFLMSAGPFTLNPGEVQEIVYGIVWAQAGSRLGSVAQMKFDDIFAQGAYNSNFNLPPAPDAPIVTATPLDGKIVLSWENPRPPIGNNYLETYNIESPFLVDPDPADENTTYTFEGYKILLFDSPTDSDPATIATLDRQNGITQIVDQAVDPVTGAVVTELVANGADVGVRNYYVIEGLTNYTDYTVAVQAYAYNPNSQPLIYQSPVRPGINRHTVMPARTAPREGGQIVLEDSIGIEKDFVLSGQGGGRVIAQVADPASITGQTYRVEFFIQEEADAINYDVINETTDETIIDGNAYYQRTGEVLRQGQNAFYADGLAFTILGTSVTCADVHLAEPFIDFGRGRPIQREFIAGPVDTTATGEIAPGDYVPETGTVIRFYSDPVEFIGDFDEDGTQDTVRAITEVAGPGGADPCPDGPNSPGCINGERIVDDPFFNSTDTWTMPILVEASYASLPSYAPNTYEVRFTEEGSVVYHAFTTGFGARWSWEIWDIGAVAPGDENDAGDDVQMIGNVFSDGVPAGECSYGWGELNLGGGFGAADRIYGYYPTDTYAAWEEATKPFIVPIQPGDVYTFDTSPFAPEENIADVAEENLDQIGIVPNPYKGASSYEVSAATDQVRFTNLPDEARIRIFSLSGDLIRTMNLSTFNNKWDLTTEEGLPLASGMYLIHVEVPNVGEKVIKFGVVKKRIQLDLF